MLQSRYPKIKWGLVSSEMQDKTKIGGALATKRQGCVKFGATSLQQRYRKISACLVSSQVQDMHGRRGKADPGVQMQQLGALFLHSLVRPNPPARSNRRSICAHALRLTPFWSD